MQTCVDLCVCVGRYRRLGAFWVRVGVLGCVCVYVRACVGAFMDILVWICFFCCLLQLNSKQARPISTLCGFPLFCLLVLLVQLWHMS